VRLAGAEAAAVARPVERHGFEAGAPGYPWRTKGVDESKRKATMSGISLERPDLDRQAAVGHGAAGARSLAVLTIPADKDYVAMARMTALHVAGIVGLPISRATDLRLAVDEGCGLFLAGGRAPLAGAGSLTLTFTRLDRILRVAISGPAPSRNLADDDLGWTLLCALGGEPRWELRGATGTLTLTETLPAGRG
jgi:hypothetical protein